jgi:hypothetical protein
MTHDPSITLRCEWRERFDTLVRERMSTPFAWGTHDCCLWAADCVLAVSGVDPAADLRGTYSSAIEAVRLVDQLGGMEAIAARGGAPIPPLCAGVGDVGLVTLDDRELLAVCAGDVWLAPGANGLAARPLAEARLAWGVAHG